MVPQISTKFPTVSLKWFILGDEKLFFLMYSYICILWSTMAGLGKKMEYPQFLDQGSPLAEYGECFHVFLNHHFPGCTLVLFGYPWLFLYIMGIPYFYNKAPQSILWVWHRTKLDGLNGNTMPLWDMHPLGMVSCYRRLKRRGRGEKGGLPVRGNQKTRLELPELMAVTFVNLWKVWESTLSVHFFVKNRSWWEILLVPRVVLY